MKDRLDKGMELRRTILGHPHVNRAAAVRTSLDEPFQDTSDRIDQRARSMLTLARFAATGNFDEVPMDVRSTARQPRFETRQTDLCGNGGDRR
ncbi:4-carboxymuconolactone decarboxylase [Thioclava sp. ES.031]|nr:4-carboxymuconolactone decarboxylase [Thioclava sp. ES.031]